MSYEGHEAVPPCSLDELMDAAYDSLEQFRERGMPDTVERNMLDRAFTSNDSSRLRALVAKFEKAIQAHDARLLDASTAALAAFSYSSIHVHSTSDTLARNAPALRQEHVVALPPRPYGAACEAQTSRLLHESHAHAAPPAAPADDCSFYPDPRAHNAPASRREHTAALPHYVGTAPRVSTAKRGRPGRTALPPQEHALAALSAEPPPVPRAPWLDSGPGREAGAGAGGGGAGGGGSCHCLQASAV
jgi:hypothetical protein